MVKQKAGIPSTAKVSLTIYPGKRSLYDYLFKSAGDSQADAMLSRAGLEPLRAAWHDDRLRVWMKGGMLRMMPFSIEIR
jgi:hypothetical protein